MNRNLSRSLVVVLILQGIILLGLWTGGHYGTPAYGQIADPAAQRAATVEELKATNAKLDKLIGILESGQLQVKVATPDENKKAKP